MQQEPFRFPRLACSQNKEAQQVCCSAICKNLALVCGDRKCPCRCQSHKSCPKYDLDYVLASIMAKKQKTPESIRGSYEQIERIIDEIIEQLSTLKDDLYLKMDTYGLSPSQAQFLNDVLAQKSQNISGQVVEKVIRDLEDEKSITWEIQQEDVTDFWKLRKPDFDKLANEIRNLIHQKGSLTFPLDSKITTESQILGLMIEESMLLKIKNCKLIYRASIEQFSVSKFHSKCDNIPNTLILIRTQFDRIIGGFTPLQWGPQNPRFQKDKSGLTFIFSLTLKEKYQILTSQSTAIHYDKNCGPAFGGGCDIQICDAADKFNTSYAYFPSSFNNGAYSNTQDSYTKFSGQAQGKNFKIKEWEVFQVNFAPPAK